MLGVTGTWLTIFLFKHQKFRPQKHKIEAHIKLDGLQVMKYNGPTGYYPLKIHEFSFFFFLYMRQKAKKSMSNALRIKEDTGTWKGGGAP
jgi:hypothetical protein